MKVKRIDLGALQDQHDATRKELHHAANALHNAQQKFDKSKKAYEKARDDLEQSTRTVLS